MHLCEYAYTLPTPLEFPPSPLPLWHAELSLLRTQVQSSVRELRKMNMSLQTVTNYDRHTLVCMWSHSYLLGPKVAQAINL